MAGVASLGVHEPSALNYMVTESILPPNPAKKLYAWHSYGIVDKNTGRTVEEEILYTQYCAIWSKSRVVQRVYNVDLEGQEILHSFVTAFAKRERPSQRLDGSNEPHAPLRGAYERALVVVLQNRAHIYFAAGDSEILPLPFEAERAWPAARGFLLQRKMSPLIKELSTPTAENSHHGAQSFWLERVWRMPEVRGQAAPRTYSVTQAQPELGLVTFSQATGHSSSRLDVLEDHNLNNDEILRYVSSCNDIHEALFVDGAPKSLAVTSNDYLNTYTIWEVNFEAEHDLGLPRKRRKVEANSLGPRRRSSNVFGRSTGAGIPSGPRGHGHGHLRESFGGLAQSHAETMHPVGAPKSKGSELEELAADLLPDFREVGVQTRAARRVSSMLARTDLYAGPDRGTFESLAQGQPLRKSLNRSMRREDSIGGFSDRQSFGTRRRSSMHGDSSVLSTGTSFLDVPANRMLEGLSGNGEIAETGDRSLVDDLSELPREVSFRKVKCLPRLLSSKDQKGKDVIPEAFILAPHRAADGNGPKNVVELCIMDPISSELIVVGLVMDNASRTGELSAHASKKPCFRAWDTWRGQNITGARRLIDPLQDRMLILRHVKDGQSTLHVEAPHSNPHELRLPPQLMVHGQLDSFSDTSPERRRNVGLKRVLTRPLKTLRGFEGHVADKILTFTDENMTSHRVLIQTSSSNKAVRDVFACWSIVLNLQDSNGMVTCWWEVLSWLRNRSTDRTDEWTALVVVIFALAIPFVDSKHAQTAVSHRRKTSGLLRSSSGTSFDMTSWESMLDQEASSGSGLLPVLKEQAWKWTSMEEQPSFETSPSKSRALKSSSRETSPKKHSYILQCISYTRDFLQTPQGEAAIGPEGYLPIAMNRDRDMRKSILGKVLLALHLLREEQKLDVRTNAGGAETGQLGPVIAQLGLWLGWQDWMCDGGGYYAVDMPDADSWAFEKDRISSLETPAQPLEPPSIFTQLEVLFAGASTKHFLTLVEVCGRSDNTSHDQYPVEAAQELMPRSFTLSRLACRKGKGATNLALVHLAVSCGLNAEMLETLPIAVAAPLHEAFADVQTNPASSLSKEALILVDRADLSLALETVDVTSGHAKVHINSGHDAQRDYHSIGNVATDADAFHTWDLSSEADRQGITRLIFGDDRRCQEASKLVNQLRPPVAECNTEPDWTEGDLLEAQRDLAYHVTRRTLAVSSGRGMMNFSARVPLLTEKIVVPAFTLQCVMKPKTGNSTSFQAVTLSADKVSFTEDKVCWAFFHNGVSSGLMISSRAIGVDTSWILYNKPLELTNRHAGFLFALGLNGHLRALANWAAFKYLTPKHTMTSIGLLLGLAASHIGTMDTLITRLLSVHVTRLLPPGAAELNLSPMTQTAGIMGIGLLYRSSQHRRMSEVMVSELENLDPEEGISEEAILRDEGYRLAAGFSLGLINLGQGKRMHGFSDMSPVERLLSVAIGTKNVDLVHVLDRATAGATIAIALMFLKTNDEAIARKIDIPDTTHQFDYVRPDLFLLRTVARHLIMWSNISPRPDFIRTSLPRAYRHRSSLKSTKFLSTEDMPLFNIIAGICLSIGLRYAGSASIEVRDLLLAYLNQFMRLTRLPALNYDAKLARDSVRNCQDVVALTAAAVMAGTGDLLLLRRFRSLHGRTDADTPYGSHLAAHMAIGTLFLGGGTYTFGTNDLAVASLLCAFYPLFPSTVLDNKAHLQAFRHFWVLAAEPRCIVPRDADTLRPLNVQLAVKLKDGSAQTLKAPCLIPELSQIASIETRSTEHMSVTLPFTTPTPAISAFTHNQSILLRRRAAYNAPTSSTFTSALQALHETHPTPSISINTTSSTSTSNNALDWLFSLPSLASLDVAERALVLPPSAGASRRLLLSSTVVDAKLELENTVLSDRAPGTMTANALWQLRLLFATDGDAEGGEARRRWLRQETVDELRYRVGKMAEDG